MDGTSGQPPGVDTAAGTRDYHRIEAAIRFIDANTLRQPTLAEIAAAVELSEHHFHRLFREWAGITPKRFLQLLTLEHAKRRLEESRSVLQASYQAGLSGPSRLHDLFVTLEGVTPGEHRAGGAGVEIRWGLATTPFGPAFVARTPRGVCQLSFLDDDIGTRDLDGPDSGAPARAPLGELASRWPDARPERDDDTASTVVERVFHDHTTPLHVRGTNFQVQVWQALLGIPPGAVVSYADVARSVGRPDAVRAVAGAVAGNRIGWLIPCHRVIRKLGEAGGYRWGTTRKRAMLAWEAADAG